MRRVSVYLGREIEEVYNVSEIHGSLEVLAAEIVNILSFCNVNLYLFIGFKRNIHFLKLLILCFQNHIHFLKLFKLIRCESLRKMSHQLLIIFLEDFIFIGNKFRDVSRNLLQRLRCLKLRLLPVGGVQV